MYIKLNDKDFVLKQFRDFLDRIPSKAELEYHVNSLTRQSRQEVNRNFAYCDEIIQLTLDRAAKPKLKEKVLYDVSDGREQFKVAVLLTGHLRSFERTYVNIRKNLILPLKADVFLHTWDTQGFQVVDKKYGPIPSKQGQIDIRKVQKLMPEIVRFQIDNNDQFLEQAKTLNQKPYVYGCPEFSPELIREPYTDRSQMSTNWIMLSALPTRIESQLYSVYRAYSLMVENELETGVKYDLVIKLRSDLNILSILPSLVNFNSQDIYIPSLPSSNHGHPFCFGCEKGYHEGRHSTDICDIYAYGGREGMSHYCRLWECIEDIYSKMTKENAEHIMDKRILYGKCDGHVVVPIWWNGPTHGLHCFYPERIFRLYLENRHLKKGLLECELLR